MCDEGTHSSPNALLSLPLIVLHCLACVRFALGCSQRAKKNSVITIKKEREKRKDDETSQSTQRRSPKHDAVSAVRLSSPLLPPSKQLACRVCGTSTLAIFFFQVAGALRCRTSKLAADAVELGARTTVPVYADVLRGCV